MLLKDLHNLFLISGLLLAVSCSTPEQPEFINIKDLKVHEFTDEQITLTGVAILFNPNRYSITVKEIDISVQVNNHAIGKVKQIGEVKVPSNSEFEVPLNVTFAPQDVYDNLLSGLINYIMKGKFAVHYTGYIRIKVSGLVFKVAVDHKGNVKI